MGKDIGSGHVTYTKEDQWLPESFDSSATVLEKLRADPSLAAGSAVRRLCKQEWRKLRGRKKRDVRVPHQWSRAQLDHARTLGDWGPQEPSDLFLKIYCDVLSCLNRDPTCGTGSPPLIGTNGTLPLTIVSVIPDIMAHYYSCIVAAEEEVFLMTNYWQMSDSVRTVSRALRDLDKKGRKIIVKIMWDRGAVMQLVHNHVKVPPKEYVKQGLPEPQEVPNLDIEVVNFHRPILGTFHQKLLIIDRKVALINSNNIQDRPNLEMMSHYEGPVVDALYDVGLVSWNETFSPPLPCVSRARQKSFSYTFQDENPYLHYIDLVKAAKAARLILKKEAAQTYKDHLALGDAQRPRFGALVDDIIERRRDQMRQAAENSSTWVGNLFSIDTSRVGPSTSSMWTPLRTSFFKKGDEGENKSNAKDDALTEGSGVENGNGDPSALRRGSPSPDEKGSASAQDEASKNGASPRSQVSSDVKSHHESAAGPDAGPAVQPHGPLNGSYEAIPTLTQHGSVGVKVVPRAGTDEQGTVQNAASLKSLSTPATELDDPLRAVRQNDRVMKLSKALNSGARSLAEATIGDASLVDEFMPHLLHAPHKPFPIALVNRRPWGRLNHKDRCTPQDAAFLGALHHAEREVFIQTPTLNSKPIVDAIVDACARGCHIVLWLGLGFNDQGESIPFQGGTNVQVVVRLYSKLQALQKSDKLIVHWYTGKDQMRPMNANIKSRNCHVKFLAVDRKVAIMGNGNQDSQSWFHSQEANLMVDNPSIVDEWLHILFANQNTHQFGKVDHDGNWRDPATGELLQQPDTVGCITALRSVM